MGLSLESESSRQIPNTTKCKTWTDVKRSHMAQEHNVVVTLDAIYGLLLILAVGLSGSMVFLSLEHLVKILKRNSR